MIETAPERPCVQPAIDTGWEALRRWGTSAWLKSAGAERLPARQLPQPFQDLLAHSKDMTPTLERFYGRRAGLRVLRREQEGRHYLREVVLTMPPEVPVEYGVIRMDLGWFEPALRQAILAEGLPLGRLLQEYALPHLCWPQGFYRFPVTRHLRDTLELRDDVELYGRRNVMVNGQRRLLADVVEILSPVAKGHRKDD